MGRVTHWHRPITDWRGTVRKFRNRPVVVDGLRFDSQAESRRYLWLKAEQAAGRIRDLVVHPVYPLVVNGQPIGRFVPDFHYVRDGRVVVEDVKSPVTAALRVYQMKKRLLAALRGIEVVEVLAR